MRKQRNIIFRQSGCSLEMKLFDFSLTFWWEQVLSGRAHFQEVQEDKTVTFFFFLSTLLHCILLQKRLLSSHMVTIPNANTAKLSKI